MHPLCNITDVYNILQPRYCTSVVRSQSLSRYSTSKMSGETSTYYELLSVKPTKGTEDSICCSTALSQPPFDSFEFIAGKLRKAQQRPIEPPGTLTQLR